MQLVAHSSLKKKKKNFSAFEIVVNVLPFYASKKKKKKISF